MTIYSGNKYIQANETTIKYCGHLLHKKPMKGGHRHRRNFATCDCGKIYRKKYDKRIGRRYAVSFWCKDITRHPDGIPMPF